MYTLMMLNYWDIQLWMWGGLSESYSVTAFPKSSSEKTKNGVNGWEKVEKRGVNVANYQSQIFSVCLPNPLWLTLLLHFILLYLEYSNSNNPDTEGLRLALDIFDYCSLFLFMVEIVLKWLDDFSNFWKNGWNIFDFIVTVGVWQF